MVNIDPVQLQQVLLNLCLNARDAMEKDGGTLSITTRPLPGNAVLEVRDTGEGISPDIIEHVFEPFFSTKETDRGTGLGLASVHGTITQSGGHIELDSNVGVGTTFRITLPRVPETTDSAPANDALAEDADTAHRA